MTRIFTHNLEDFNRAGREKHCIMFLPIKKVLGISPPKKFSQ